jgi:predicted esterase
MSRHRRLVKLGVALATLAAGLVGGLAAERSVVSAESPPSFVGLSPARLADSRPGGATFDGQLSGGGIRTAGMVTPVPVAGRAGVPAGALAVSLNVTVTEAAGSGYATVYPCGSPTPNASNLNFVPGDTIANAAVVKLGDGGAVCVYVSQPTHLVVDVGGYFPAGASFQGIAPLRLADTRPSGATFDGALKGGGPRATGSVLPVPVVGRTGLPASAAAVALNVTVTEAAGSGYATVYPCGSPTPNASNLNFVVGQTIPNAAIVKVGDNGSVCVYVSQPAHVIVDVGGFFPVGSSFTGLSPARLADTRPGAATVDGGGSGGGPKAAATVLTVPVVGRGGVAGASAVTLNVTVTEAGGSGYATVYPCGSPTPNASNLNFVPDQTIANAAVVKVGDGGAVCVYVSQPTHLIVDVGGYFPGSGGGDPNPTSSVPTNPIAYPTAEAFSLDTALSNYFIYVPSTYDSTHKTATTLLVWLHGCGGFSEGDIQTVSPGGDQDWISIAVGGRDGDCWDVNNDDKIVKAAIADVKTHFNIDPHRVILGGYSSGGDLSYRMAFYNSTSFAGVLAENTAPFRDTGSTQADSLAAATRKFNVVHLAHLQDDVYPIGQVRAEINAMKAAGFPVTLIERTGTHYDDPGANVDGQAVPGTDADLINLLLPHIHDGWRTP